MKILGLGFATGLLMLLSGCISDIVIPKVDVPVVNQKPDGTFESAAELKLYSNDKSFGTIALSYSDDSISLDFFPDDGMYVRSYRYHISTSPNNIPQVNGRADVERFQFDEKTHKLPLSQVTGNAKYRGKLYMAIRVIFSFGEVLWQDGQIEVKRTHELGDPSYFVISLWREGQLRREYYGYCLQGDQRMDATQTHLVNLAPSQLALTGILDPILDEPGNVPKVNWILNQPRSQWKRADNAAATGADIQMAIWSLLERTGSPTGTRIQGKFDPTLVEKIVADANKYGKNFRPVCGQKYLIVLHKGALGGIDERGNYNKGAYGNPDFQVCGLVKTMECSYDDRACWPQGKDFDSGEGSYFGLYIGD